MITFPVFFSHIFIIATVSICPTRTMTAASFKVCIGLLLKIFNIDNIIALGRKPESKLKGFGYHYGYIRHPANGGKNKFVNGLKEVLK